MEPPEMAKIFAKWNEGELASYLIEITAKILDRKDDVTGEGYVVDYVSIPSLELFHNALDVSNLTYISILFYFLFW